VIARRQLAQVLVASLTSESALRKTFELVAVKGPAQHDLAPLFAALEADPPGGLDAVRDLPNMPLPEEPKRVRDALLLMGADGGFITGSDFLMDGGVTAAYWYGDVAEVRTS
jgi:hypothetical protein